MRKLMVLMFVFAFSFVAMASDHYNSGSVTIKESATQISYIWTLTVPAEGDSTGSWHSPALFIGDCNDTDGYVYAVGTAGANTEDVNLLFHYSFDDRNSWDSVTPSDYDALGGTVVTDTIGYNDGSDDLLFHNARFIVVEYDGQASNESNRAFTFVLTVKKDFTITDSKQLMGSYARKNNTNP